MLSIIMVVIMVVIISVGLLLIFAALLDDNENICKCGNKEFYIGPEGFGRNVLCAKCYTEYQQVPMEGNQLREINDSPSKERLRDVYGVYKE